jgi:site-specific recombinase
MDSDGDLRITPAEIKAFSISHYITLDDKIYEDMFKEAASKRIVTNPN